MPSPNNETLANMMRRMSTNSPVKKSAKTTKKTPVKKSTAEEKQKKRVESIVKLMEKDKTYTPWIHGARPKGYKKPSTIVGPDDAMRNDRNDMRLKRKNGSRRGRLTMNDRSSRRRLKT
jgi:hypothetical protein